MSRAKVGLVTSLVTATILSCSVLAQETAAYSYGALARLDGSTISSGTNNGRITSVCFDEAGNRMRYDVATSPPPACPWPSPAASP
jgi:hypothetical protein